MATIDVALDVITIYARRRPIDAAKAQELAASMAELGLLEPIVVTPAHVLVAGLHRIAAAKLLGWTTISASMVMLTPLDAELAEIDENLIRAELTVLEQGEHLARRNEILREKRARAASHRPKKGETVSPFQEVIQEVEKEPHPKTTADIANEAGLSERSAQQRVQIATKLTPAVREAIRATPLADQTTELLRLSRQAPEAQSEIVARVQDGRAKTVKDAVLEIRREERMDGLVAAALPVSSGRRYPVIYADPPWRYEFSSDVADEIEQHYPTMDLADICALPIAALTNDDAILFLWTTSPKLEESMKVIAAWGFQYRTSMVWVKDWISMGYYARQQHELLLIARKGNMPTPAPSDRPSSVVHAPKRLTARSRRNSIG